jgi:hypothetical protein
VHDPVATIVPKRQGLHVLVLVLHMLIPPGMQLHVIHGWVLEAPYGVDSYLSLLEYLAQACLM